jgi:hypothetical protein
MSLVELPITNGFYESDSLPLSHQQCINWYPNIVQTQGLSQESLFGTPGTVQRTTTGTVAEINRESHEKNGIPYFVNGTTLYSLDRTINPDLSETFTTTALGTVAGSGRVSMTDNGTQLMILVPGGNGYIFDENAGTPFQQITDADFTANGNPQVVVFVDGYFAATTDSKKWIISALNDGLSWNALDFATAESDPDVTVAPVVANNQAFITGSQTTEGFQNRPAGAGFPFIRSNIFLDKGCFAPFSLVKTSGTFMMIGGGEDETPAVWMFNGNGYTKISTTAIDNVLASATDEEIDNAFALSYAQKGAYFVVFTVGSRSFGYDTITARWHERSSHVNGNDIAWRVNSIVTAYGRVWVGDSIDGRIGELSSECFTEYGEEIRRVVSTQPFANLGRSVKVPRIELTMESGVGNSDRPDPKVSMEISDDSKKFKDQRIRSIGKIGEFDTRQIWLRNGRAPRFRVLRFRMSDPVKPVIIKLEAKFA